MNPSLVDTISFSGKSHWAQEIENTVDPTLIYIARNGHIIGRYYFDGIRKGFACGFFLPTDLGWEPALGAWLLLTEIVNFPATSGEVPLASETLDEEEPGVAEELPLAESQPLPLSLDEYLEAVQV
jgi:hypothetical protein